MMTKTRTNQQLRLYYYDGIIANSKEELKKKLKKKFNIYKHMQEFNSVINDICKRIKYIILNRNYKYLVNFQYCNQMSYALFTADELYNKINNLFQYIRKSNSKKYVTISMFTNKSKFAKIICRFHNDAQLDWGNI